MLRTGLGTTGAMNDHREALPCGEDPLRRRKVTFQSIAQSLKSSELFKFLLYIVIAILISKFFESVKQQQQAVRINEVLGSEQKNITEFLQAQLLQSEEKVTELANEIQAKNLQLVEQAQTFEKQKQQLLSQYQQAYEQLNKQHNAEIQLKNKEIEHMKSRIEDNISQHERAIELLNNQHKTEVQLKSNDIEHLQSRLEELQKLYDQCNDLYKQKDQKSEDYMLQYVDCKVNPQPVEIPKFTQISEYFMYLVIGLVSLLVMKLFLYLLCGGGGNGNSSFLSLK